MLFAFKKIVLVAASYCYALIRGRAISLPDNPKRIVVIQMAKLGDMVCSTPVFHAIKQQYPTSEVHVMGDQVNEGVVADNRDVDSYFVFRGIASAIDLLRKERYEVAVILGAPDITSIFVAFMAGVPGIIGPTTRSRTPHNSIWYRLMARLIIRVSHEEGDYAPLAYLRRLAPLGIEMTDTRKYLAHSEHASEAASLLIRSRKVPGRPLVGITASAGNKVKEWPADRFAAVADHLIEEYGAEIVIFGGPRDVQETGAMLSSMSYANRVLNTSGTLSIDMLKAVIGELDLFIAADTGLIYIAEAYSVATIDIVGPVDEREQPPKGRRHRIIIPEGRGKPALSILNSKHYDLKEVRRQAESTPVARVTEEAADLLQELGFRGTA